MKIYMMEILYMASIYGLVTEIKKKLQGFYGKAATTPFLKKKIYSGFYGKTAAKPFLQRFLT
jgi:hypothetical protein